MSCLRYWVWHKLAMIKHQFDHFPAAQSVFEFQLTDTHAQTFLDVFLW